MKMLICDVCKKVESEFAADVARIEVSLETIEHNSADLETSSIPSALHRTIDICEDCYDKIFGLLSIEED